METRCTMSFCLDRISSPAGVPFPMPKLLQQSINHDMQCKTNIVIVFLQSQYDTEQTVPRPYCKFFLVLCYLYTFKIKRGTKQGPTKKTQISWAFKWAEISAWPWDFCSFQCFVLVWGKTVRVCTFGFIMFHLFLHIFQAPVQNGCTRLTVFALVWWVCVPAFCTISIKLWCQSQVVLCFWSFCTSWPNIMQSATNHQKVLQQAIEHLLV